MSNGDEETEKAVIAHNAAEYQQMELILEGKKFFIDHSAPKFNHTALRFIRDRKDIVEPVIKLLAAKISHQTIGDQFRISHHTLHALELEMMEDILEERKTIAKRCLNLGGMAQERAAELLPTCPSLKDVSIAGGIWLTKAQELSGQPTVRIEIDHKIDIHAKIDSAYNKIIEEFNSLKQAKIIGIEDTELPA